MSNTKKHGVLTTSKVVSIGTHRMFSAAPRQGMCNTTPFNWHNATVWSSPAFLSRHLYFPPTLATWTCQSSPELLYRHLDSSPELVTLALHSASRWLVTRHSSFVTRHSKLYSHLFSLNQTPFLSLCLCLCLL